MTMKHGTSHYKNTKIEPLDVIEDWGLDFNLGNVIKYIGRNAKGGKRHTAKMEDLIDAAFYLQLHVLNQCKTPIELLEMSKRMAEAQKCASSRVILTSSAQSPARSDPRPRKSPEPTQP